jgi:hypothetical protein
MAPLRARFAVEIAQGRLTLLNVALAPERKLSSFWICDGHSLWNSFDREVASRKGRKCRAVKVECYRLRDIFVRYGVPHYLKLSLHGHEHFCLADIEAEAAPTYLSLELPRDLGTSEGILSRLSSLGYDSFKIIDQTTQKQLTISPPTLKSWVKEKLRQHAPLPLYEVCESITEWSRRLVGSVHKSPGKDSSSDTDSPAGWVFPEGSSGPFGEETYGAWHSGDETRAAWTTFLSGETDQGQPSLSIWHDLHATRAKSRESSRPLENRSE